MPVPVLPCPGAEAHASLAAALWAAGREDVAEEQFLRAQELEPSWRSPEYLHGSSVRWPPALVTALQHMQALQSSA